MDTAEAPVRRYEVPQDWQPPKCRRCQACPLGARGGALCPLQSIQRRVHVPPDAPVLSVPPEYWEERLLPCRLERASWTPSPTVSRRWTVCFSTAAGALPQSSDEFVAE